MNYEKLQDFNSHWYWIPTELAKQFEKDSLSLLECLLQGRYATLAFDDFDGKYGSYRTYGDANCVPEAFKSLQKPKQSIDWIPIDIGNLPDGEVLATDGVYLLVGYVNIDEDATYEEDRLPKCDSDDTELTNVTHYIPIENLLGTLPK